MQRFATICLDHDPTRILHGECPDGRPGGRTDGRTDGRAGGLTEGLAGRLAAADG